jgi:signal transduction histidine kinase
VLGGAARFASGMSAVFRWRLDEVRDIPVRFGVLAGGGAVAVLMAGVSTQQSPWVGTSAVEAGESLAKILVVLLAGVPVLALFRPVWAGVVGLLPLLLTYAGATAERQMPWVVYLALVLAAMVASRDRPVHALVPALAALVPILGYVFGVWALVMPFNGGLIESQYGGIMVVEFGLYLLATLLALGFANRMRITVARDRRRAAREVAVEEQSTVVAERARLAHDLHDVVAHHVSLIAVRAETAPYTVLALSPSARELFADIAEDSRRALDELRSVLGILRRSGVEAGRAPQPTACDIAGLVSQAVGAGDQVVWAPVDLSAVGLGAGYVAYRVAQESLTNARRHAPGAVTRVETTVWDGSGILVRVTNPSPASGAPERPAGGGLAGMRERVEAVGGTLTVEHSDGVHVVEARIPGVPPEPNEADAS